MTAELGKDRRHTVLSRIGRLAIVRAKPGVWKEALRRHEELKRMLADRPREEVCVRGDQQYTV